MVKKSLARDCFILLKPEVLSNAEKTARAIATFKGVKEVKITSGDYGFIVAAEHDESGRISSRIMRLTRRPKSSIAISHYAYRCQRKV